MQQNSKAGDTGKEAPAAEMEPRKPVAVIDIGSSSIRMEIAEISRSGRVFSLETLQHPVDLGKDTFTQGRLDASTIEECASVLRGFRRIMREYGIEDERQIRAVATSSVREAANRETFLNRILIAAHIRVEIIDEAEVNRLTYIAIRDNLERQGALDDSDTLAVEVGGGSTEVLLMQAGLVTQSRTYRLGALRMREMLGINRTPEHRVVAVLGRHIQRTVDQMLWTLREAHIKRLIVLGGDVRLAAQELVSAGNDDERLAPVPLSKFKKLATTMASVSVDDLVRENRLSYQEAETVGPALLAYARMAEAFAMDQLWIAAITLRDGLLLEMATRGSWTDHFKAQVQQSARALGRKYQYEEKHATHVAELCARLYVELQDEHELDPRYDLLLRMAAQLHEIGLFVANQSHHKHSMYLIMNSDLFGLSKADTTLVALIARYHRRAIPRPTHMEYMSLPQNQRLIVSKLAAILRVADALDQNHNQQFHDIGFLREKDRLVILVRGVEDMTLERVALKQKGEMFEEVYGMKVELRKDTGRKGVAYHG